MKLKYFLRGLGAGIIFGALIMLAAYMTSGSYKVSDEEIIKRAKELGMVQGDNSIIATTAEEKEDKTSEDVKSTEPSEQSTKETTENTTETTTEATTEATTETTTEATTEATTQSASGDTVTISVRSGMGSYEVSVILKDAGIIEDASDFDAYLNANGYSTRIEVGEYICSPDMTYEQLAEMLLKGN